MPVSVLRETVATAVAAASLRSVAADVDMSPTGLRDFLNGRKPYSATLRKLTAWYVRYQLSRNEFDADTARAALHVLLEAFPRERVGRVSERLLRSLDEIHHDEKIAPPAWLRALDGGGREEG